jgi:hypothetical protein
MERGPFHTRSGRIHASSLLGIVAVLLFVGNVMHFLTRPYEASFYQTSYATIYFPTDRPVVEEWREVEGGIEAVVKWDAPVEGWKLFLEDELVSENSGPDIFFPVDEAESVYRTYTVEAQPKGLHPAFPMKVRYLSEAFNADRGLPRPGFSIVMSDEPMGNFKQYPVSDWVDTYEYVGSDELAEVDAILQEHVGIDERDTTLEKLEKIMIHQRQEMDQACRGTPPPDLRWKNPYTIYKEMRDNEAHGLVHPAGAGVCLPCQPGRPLNAPRARCPHTAQQLCPYRTHVGGSLDPRARALGLGRAELRGDLRNR